MSIVDSVSDEDLHWLAGLLEGEGSFMRRGERLAYRGGKKLVRYNPEIQVKVKMTDKDIIQRARDILGGVIAGPYIAYGTENPGNYKVQWQASVYRQELAVAWCKKLRPLMGVRRQEQIDVCLGLKQSVVTYTPKYRDENQMTLWSKTL